mgnify:CR=1 FL=1
MAALSARDGSVRYDADRNAFFLYSSRGLAEGEVQAYPAAVPGCDATKFIVLYREGCRFSALAVALAESGKARAAEPPELDKITGSPSERQDKLQSKLTERFKMAPGSHTTFPAVFVECGGGDVRYIGGYTEFREYVS